MILPMAEAISQRLKGTEGDKTFIKIIFLSIPYASLIGGIATLVGTGSNLIFVQQLSILYPKYGSFPFIRWSLFCLPVSFIFLLTTWILFSIIYLRGYKLSIETSFFYEEYKKLGCIKFEEVLIIFQFLVMALLWILRELPFGENIGWGFWFKPKFVTDGTIAIIIAITLFALPSLSRPGEQILDWELASKKIPWGLNLLIGAGFSFSVGFQRAGLGPYISQYIPYFRRFSPLTVLVMVLIMIAFVSEVITNVAVAAIALPILGRIGPQLGQNPLFFMMPIAICTSYSFMSPFTLPNAVAYAYGKYKFFDMLPIGFILNCLGIFFVILGTYTIGGPTLGIIVNVSMNHSHLGCT